MSPEVIDKLEELIHESRRVKFHRVEGQPADVICKEMPDGEVSWFFADPKPARHGILSLGSLVGLALDVNARRVAAESEVEPTPVSLWYSRDGVVALLDPDNRRDTAEVSLKLSHPLMQLMEWASSSEYMSQERLVWKLKTLFKNRVHPLDFAAKIEAVNFSVAGATSSVVAHGKRSVSKSLENQISGQDSLPTYITMTFPIWAVGPIDIHGAVECAVDVDPQRQSFLIQPLPNEIEAAVQRGEEQLAERLRKFLLDDDGDKCKLPVYYGKPT